MVTKMKILYNHNKPNPQNPYVYIQLGIEKPKFLFEKEVGFAIRRRSSLSFFYREKLYDFKHNVIKDVKSNAYKLYERELSNI